MHRRRLGTSIEVVILDGVCAVDESMVTGEPIPVGKTPSSRVAGGTVNDLGGCIMRVERVGSDTLLAQIVRMVSAAESPSSAWPTWSPCTLC